MSVTFPLSIVVQLTDPRPRLDCTMALREVLKVKTSGAHQRLMTEQMEERLKGPEGAAPSKVESVKAAPNSVEAPKAEPAVESTADVIMQ